MINNDRIQSICLIREEKRKLHMTQRKKNTEKEGRKRKERKCTVREECSGMHASQDGCWSPRKNSIIKCLDFNKRKHLEKLTNCLKMEGVCVCVFMKRRFFCKHHNSEQRTSLT